MCEVLRTLQVYVVFRQSYEYTQPHTYLKVSNKEPQVQENKIDLPK